MSEIIIRRAVSGDAPAVLAYLRQIGGETDNLTFGPEGLPFTVEEEQAYIESRAASTEEVLYLVLVDGEIVADGSISRLPRRMSHRAELGISVRKAYWGQGIGTRLMQALIAFAAGSSAQYLCLEVRSDNRRAIALYEKSGFQKIATYPGYMKIGDKLVDVDFMTLRLEKGTYEIP